MAQPKPDRSNISPLAGHDRKPRTVDSGHGWLVPHLISLIGYAERHGLTDVEKALTEAAERIAPGMKPQQEIRGGEALVFLHPRQMPETDQPNDSPL
ncbi:hypothetical protein SAMN05878503_101341 [Cereibacter ovatus]|uniref:Uncharacterized protein n=1 Tax=Cereibacter ovatus TaxID=439529 RepID=A0A285CL08_9RHOB|nr:hypothetical protein [Cereibacter ovatus]SNX67703.1 hypothetical protein SAMN05878503_101341 [Cereibacter ovatus]